MKINLLKVFENFKLPISYSIPENGTKLPFLVYLGDGSDNFLSDNVVDYSLNRYLLQYYFSQKDEDIEEEIEQRLKEHRIIWTKSADIYNGSERYFLINYYLGGANE